MRTSFFLPLILLVTLLAGCSQKGSWLQGRWVLDRELTRQKMEEQATHATEKSEGLGGMVKNLASSMAAPLILSTLENAEITFTKKEVITTINGNGKATPYEVVETPDPDTVVIKKADGEVQTFRREGDRLSTTGTGAMALTLYLKKAER